MKYNGINFNLRFYKGKPLDQFIKNETHHGLSTDQMTECHKLCQTFKDEKQLAEEKAKEKTAETPAAGADASKSSATTGGPDENQNTKDKAIK